LTTAPFSELSAENEKTAVTMHKLAKGYVFQRATSNE
jgi:hypothetical protein